MSTASIVLLIIGLVVLVHSLVALSFPKCSIKCYKKLYKNVKKMKKIATWELVIAIILLIIAINI